MPTETQLPPLFSARWSRTIARQDPGGSYIMHCKENGQIVAVQNGPTGRVYEVGETVESAGRIGYLPAKGTLGVIYAINEPHKEGRSNNILQVRWSDGEDSFSVKFKDLTDRQPDMEQ
ncbi:MAG TPA: hypothetical protein VLA04_04255 [Verrucomicrobiae bacterium]|nr:hypothetical protein [Verrucomicrobiae bacterium]